MFIYEGHRVKVEVTGVKTAGPNPYSHNVKLRSAITQSHEAFVQHGDLATNGFYERPFSSLK